MSERTTLTPKPSTRFTSGVRQSGARRMMDLAWSIPDAIHLEIGEPDFTAADHIVEAATRVMRDGDTGYPPTAGLPELREALTDKLAKVNQIRCDPDGIVVSNGGCQGLFNAMSVLVDEGDTVALPDPGWPNYRSMAGLLGARITTYSLPAETGHQPDPEEIERLAASGCRVLVLNNPANPLGSVTPEPVLQRLVDSAVRHGMWILSDECYDELSFGGMPTSPAALTDAPNVISVFSFSKTHAMTGWRVGYVAARGDVAELVARAQEPLVMGINAPAQHGALAALEDDRHVAIMRDAYRDRQHAVVDAMRSLGRDVTPGDGAFYLWLDIRDTGVEDDRFVLTYLEQEHVAIAPGSSFGDVGRGFIRLSLAADQDALLEAVTRLGRHLDRARDGALG